MYCGCEASPYFPPLPSLLLPSFITTSSPSLSYGILGDTLDPTARLGWVWLPNDIWCILDWKKWNNCISACECNGDNCKMEAYFYGCLAPTIFPTDTWAPKHPCSQCLLVTGHLALFTFIRWIGWTLKRSWNWWEHTGLFSPRRHRDCFCYYV